MSIKSIGGDLLATLALGFNWAAGCSCCCFPLPVSASGHFSTLVQLSSPARRSNAQLCHPRRAKLGSTKWACLWPEDRGRVCSLRGRRAGRRETDSLQSACLGKQLRQCLGSVMVSRPIGARVSPISGLRQWCKGALLGPVSGCGERN